MVDCGNDTTNSTDHYCLYHVPWADTLFGIASLLSALFGMVGSAMLIKLYLPLHRSLPAKLFLVIAANDLVTSLFGALPFSLPRLDHETLNWAFYVPFLCNSFGVLLNISERYSVFLIAVLSTTRAWALKFPLRRIKQWIILVLLGSYLTLQILLASLPFYAGKLYWYDDVYTVCTWNVDDIIPYSEETAALYKTTFQFLILIPFSIPSLFVIMSCVVCVVCLQKSINRRKFINGGRNRKSTVLAATEGGGGGNTKNKASITVVIFTITYITLHVPLWIFLMLFLVMSEGKLQMDFAAKLPIYLFVFSSKVSVFINAGINPIIVVSRTKSMQESFKTDVLRFTETIRRTTRISNSGYPMTSFVSPMGSPGLGPGRAGMMFRAASRISVVAARSARTSAEDLKTVVETPT
eukprot:sb/3465234/